MKKKGVAKSSLSWFGCVRELLGRRFVSDLPAMVPGLVAYTASAPLVEITVPVLAAHAIEAAD